MGVHYVNGQYVGDAVIDPLKPEAMVYVQGGGGALKLGAVEYIVFKDVWETAHGVGADPPRLFDTSFDLTPDGEPIRDPRVLLAARVAVPGEPGRPAHAVEPEGDLP